MKIHHDGHVWHIEPQNESEAAHLKFLLTALNNQYGQESPARPRTEAEILDNFSSRVEDLFGVRF